MNTVLIINQYWNRRRYDMREWRFAENEFKIVEIEIEDGLDKIAKLIKKADVIVLTVGKDFYEESLFVIGYAVGAKKPLVINGMVSPIMRNLIEREEKVCFFEERELFIDSLFVEKIMQLVPKKSKKVLTKIKGKSAKEQLIMLIEEPKIKLEISHGMLEKIIGNFLEDLGYSVELNIFQNEGYDIFAQNLQNGERLLIEIKAKVKASVMHLQKLRDAMYMKEANIGIVISLNGISAAAKAYAEDDNIKLWEIKDLVRLADKETVFDI